jgi:hypothetical protein
MAVGRGPEDGTHFEEFVDSSAILDDPEALRARARADGYLFIRGLLPADAVHAARRQVMERLDEFGWLDRTAPLGDGVIDDAAINGISGEELRPDIGISRAGYLRIQQLRDLHALPHHRNLISLYERLTDDFVFVHPRHIVRVFTSHRDLHPTPAHQDFPLVQGTDKTWTCWFPLGDCGLDLGPVTICEGSHTAGYRPVEEAPGAGGIAVQRCGEETAAEIWRRGPFRAGDVLTFTAMTVHRALPATRRDRIRLSMDVRYQAISEPIEAKSLGNHLECAWEDVYADWDDDDPLRYYWHGATPPLADWNNALIQPSRRIC